MIDRPEPNPTLPTNATTSHEVIPQTHLTLSQQHFSPEHIRPFPKAVERKGTAKCRKRGRCMIATDTSEKLKLEQKELEKK